MMNWFKQQPDMVHWFQRRPSVYQRECELKDQIGRERILHYEQIKLILRMIDDPEVILAILQAIAKMRDDLTRKTTAT